MTYIEFKKTIYYTQLYVRIPLLNMRLDKIEFLKKGKLDLDAINSRLMEIYEENKEKLK